MTPQDKSRLQGLLSSQEWKIIDNLRLEYCRRIQERAKTADTMEATAIATVRDEGMIQGVTNFFQELWNQAK